jgi:TnpA family transposase
MTDTGAYSDVVFGLFRLLGYRFSPRLADIGGTRFWRIDPNADYGKECVRKSGVGGVGVGWAHASDNTLQTSDFTSCSAQP